MLRYVYSPTVDPTSSDFDTPAHPHGKPETMVDAINRTMKDEMAHNPRIIVLARTSQTRAARKH